MQRVTNYLKMRVLGALENASGTSHVARYQAVSQMAFLDEQGQLRRFTWRTIQTWWYYYRKHGITEGQSRADKGSIRKVIPEQLLEAIEQVMPHFHNKKYNIAEIYRACIQRGLLQRSQVAPNTFRRFVHRYDLLKPCNPDTPKARLAFAKAHANDLWQGDTMQFGLICSRLGTVLIHTPVRDGAAKGKIERFFRTVRDQFLVRNLSQIHHLEQLNHEFTHWIESTYHTREHATLGMKPIDRFGLDLNLIRRITHNTYDSELFLLESTRKVRTDNTFSYDTHRFEAPCDLRNTTITIRHNRPGIGFLPIVYQNSHRLGEATKLDLIANDRYSHIEF